MNDTEIRLSLLKNNEENTTEDSEEEIENSEDYLDIFPELENKIKLKSDAYINGCPNISNPSEIHYVLKNLKISHAIKELKESIYYSNLEIKHINQIMSLHREWFPVEYTKDYLLNFIHDNNINTIAIGCFIKIIGREFLIGSIMCNFHNENKFIKTAPDYLIKRNCIK